MLLSTSLTALLLAGVPEGHYEREKGTAMTK